MTMTNWRDLFARTELRSWDRQHSRAFAKILVVTFLSIKEFHDRWGIEPDSGIAIAKIEEEVEELREALSEGRYDDALLELADVLYMAMGDLALAGDAGLEAMLQVIEKNDAKTADTHCYDQETGAIVRKESANRKSCSDLDSN